MVFSETAQDAYHHIIKLGSKKLSEFVEWTGPIEIPVRYGEDQLLGLARIVVGQQLSNQAASSIWTRICKDYPKRTDLLQVLRDPETENTGLSASKKRTLSELMLLGDPWLSEIAKRPEFERRESLLEIWGLGPWSVAMWELFVLQSPDQWSDNDLILKRISEDLAADADTERVHFINTAAPFRSYLALYCWRFNDTRQVPR